MRKGYLSLGSNLGDSLGTVERAFEAIAEIPGVSLLKTSGMYRTTPVSDVPQADYLNAACLIETDLEAHELLQRLQAVEVALGKRAKARNAPREIDIDILFLGEERHDTPDLILPHPRWRERLFVLVPLAELGMDVKELIETFSHLEEQCVFPLNKTGEKSHDYIYEECTSKEFFNR